MGFDHGLSLYKDSLEQENLVTWRKQYALSSWIHQEAKRRGFHEWGTGEGLDPHIDVDAEFLLALLREYKDYDPVLGCYREDKGFIEAIRCAMRGERVVYWESI